MEAVALPLPPDTWEALAELERMPTVEPHIDVIILALYPRTELAKDADIPFGPAKTGEFSIGHLWEIIWNPQEP